MLYVITYNPSLYCIPLILGTKTKMSKQTVDVSTLAVKIVEVYSAEVSDVKLYLHSYLQLCCITSMPFCEVLSWTALFTGRQGCR